MSGVVVPLILACSSLEKPGAILHCTTVVYFTQIEGAFVQGMGLFTTEQLEFTCQGNLLSIGPNTYMIPTMSDIPAEFYVHLLPGVQNPKGLYSSKVFVKLWCSTYLNCIT